MSLLLIDVDRFRAFNDLHGVETGDQVLKMIGVPCPTAVSVSRMSSEDLAAKSLFWACRPPIRPAPTRLQIAC